MLAGASEEEVSVIEKVASDVGIAFQIRDDILDVTSTLEELGKPIHSDDKNEKTTYVTLKGLKQAESECREKTDKTDMVKKANMRAKKLVEDMFEGAKKCRKPYKVSVSVDGDEYINVNVNVSDGGQE